MGFDKRDNGIPPNHYGKRDNHPMPFRKRKCRNPPPLVKRRPKGESFRQTLFQLRNPQNDKIEFLFRLDPVVLKRCQTFRLRRPLFRNSFFRHDLVTLIVRRQSARQCRFACKTRRTAFPSAPEYQGRDEQSTFIRTIFNSPPIWCPSKNPSKSKRSK